MKRNVIFDMDGVISDTQIFHAQTESILLKKYGINMSPEEITYKYAGVSDDRMFAEIFTEHGQSSIDIRELLNKKWGVMMEITSGKIQPIEGALALINKLYKEGRKLAVASASTEKFIQLVLKELKIENHFISTVSSQHVKNGKPAPDIFLLAAFNIGSQAADCVVIEDGISGMKAARAAGMKCIALNAGMDNSLPADTIVQTLHEVTSKLVDSI